MMNSKIMLLLSVLAVSGCKTTQQNTFDPQYLASIKEGKALEVPHRDWISEGCYPSRQQIKGKWTEVKICDKK